jgi:hypothetical protein
MKDEGDVAFQRLKDILITSEPVQLILDLGKSFRVHVDYWSRTLIPAE